MVPEGDVAVVDAKGKSKARQICHEKHRRREC